jgi:hypothetical protein
MVTELPERIGGVSEQIFAAVHVADGLDHAKWNPGQRHPLSMINSVQRVPR